MFNFGSSMVTNFVCKSFINALFALYLQLKFCYDSNCDPNTLRCNIGNTLIIIAARDINSGENNIRTKTE